MSRKFKHPPLAEALCEFRFELTDPFDPTLPGIIYSKLSGTYPIRKQRNMGFPNVKKETNETELVFGNLAQFRTEDDSMLIQVGGNMLSVNCVKDYPHWEKFKPRIMEALKIYLDEAKPISIIRIGVRCINKIFAKGDRIELSDHFKFLPVRPENLKEIPYSAFNVHVEALCENNRDLIVMKNFTIVPEGDNQAGFMLDLEYAMNQPNGLAIDERTIDDWLEIAHQNLNNAFENSLTEEQLDKFDQ